MNKSNYAIFFVGIAGVGKTTFADENEKGIISTYAITDRIASDDIIEDIAQSLDKTYSDVFVQSIDLANKYAEVMVGIMSTSKRNFIIDRTNLTVKSRQRMLNLIKNTNDYTKIAVVFKEPDAIELRRRLDDRANFYGKIITPVRTKEMQDRYEEPTISEGFDKVMSVEEFEKTLGIDNTYGEARFG